MTNKLRTKEKGFTIIEVMIVLAVAGLIMLIVFLAVPALQRNQRNTSRRADASRVSTAVANFVSNNNGSIPTSAADATTILNDAGSLAQFGSLTGATKGGACDNSNATAISSDLNICTGAATTLKLLTAGQDGMVLATGATCGNGGAVTTGTAKQMALYYTVETNSAPTWSCIQL